MDFLSQIFDVESITEMLIQFVPRIAGAVFILVSAWVVYAVTGRSLRAIFRRAGFQETMIRLLINNVYSVILFLVAILMALGQLGEADKAWQYYDRLVEEMEANPPEATLRYQAEAAEILGENP